MKPAQDDIIQAQTAPLSHLKQSKQDLDPSQRLDRRGVAVVVVVLLVGVLAISFGVLDEREPDIAVPLNDAEQSSQAAQTSSQTVATNPGSTLTPFAETQRKRAQKKAQDALAGFVEKQILLEDTMRVDLWGEDMLSQALEIAKRGDAEFAAGEYDTALESYNAGVAKLSEVIVRGEQVFAGHIADARRALSEFEPQTATQAIQAAMAIKPTNPDAQVLLQRAQLQPEIIGMLRTAKNHELGGRFAQALAIYQDIEQKDPQTTGLEDLKTTALAAQSGDELNNSISRGFDLLNRQQFDEAKRAFQRALKLDPNNDIAKGALQQVAKDNDLALINGYVATAQQAMQQESWTAAVDAYQAVLNLDANIQVAKSGLKSALAHRRVHDLLGKIKQSPQKLSSESLFLEAQGIVADADELEYAGKSLNGLKNEVAALLVLYRDPVDVVLLSDNATKVIVSNVGQLGFFERKTLTLRPGQYTIRGSQDGCRDIFLDVEILPGIEPLNVRCEERISTR